MMERSRRRGAGVEVASWVFLLSFFTEVSALNNGYIGSTGGGCPKVGRNAAVAASCPLTSRLPKGAVLLKTSYGGSHSRRHGKNGYPLMGRLTNNQSIVGGSAGRTETNRPKQVGSPWSSSTCLRAVEDSSGRSDRARYGVARAEVQEERVPGGREPAGNILQRLSMVALERSAAAIPQLTTSSTATSLSVLPSDPIKRFSSDSRIGDRKAVGNNRALSGTTSSTSSDNVIASSGPSALEAFAETGGTSPSSLANRVAAELRRRTVVSGQLHRDTHNQSGQPRAPKGIYHGVQQLNAVITRVEAKLSFDSSEAGQLRVRNNH